DVRPGMEGYVASRGPQVIGGQTVIYSLDVVIHVGPTYDATHPGSWTGAPDGYNSYGPFGDAWTNDATFYAQNASGGWYIDDTAFYTQTSAWLSDGIPVWLTIDQDAAYGGDHWVPMVKVDDAGHYYYYDTYSGTLQSANIAYVGEYGYGGTHAISAVRTVSLGAVISGGGGEVPVPEPSTLLLVGSGVAWLLAGRVCRRRRRG
ncbi:MAG TPA: PEP-CTERM sorting domain-containing protein, partial [Candidatus Latescibacteria bacterium]|nr:PEP-CTERM sorting domain-containing protein [Candidatus Latescibacterota bacterium]